MAIGLLSLSACGTLASVALPHRVAVDSDPRGATVMCCGAVVGTTPCEVEVDSDHRVLELQLDGYQSRALTLPLVENRWVACNVLTLGIGMFLDEALDTDSVPCTAPLLVHLHPGNGCVTVVRVCPNREAGRETLWRPGEPLAENIAEGLMLIAYYGVQGILR